VNAVIDCYSIKEPSTPTNSFMFDLKTAKRPSKSLIDGPRTEYLALSLSGGILEKVCHRLQDFPGKRFIRYGPGQ
jgi:hypothetical protein